MIPVTATRFPSSEEERDVLIEAYKEHASKIPCRYETAEQDCPFGSSCFYAHRGDKAVLLRHATNDQEVTVELGSRVPKLSDFIVAKLQR